MNTPTDLTHDGREIRLVRAGIFQCLVEYVHLFKTLERRPGNASCRQFHVQTSILDQENGTCLAKDLLNHHE